MAMQHVLEELLTPSVLRKILGLRDLGELVKVRVGHPDGDAPSARDGDGRWVGVWVQRALSVIADEGLPMLARLFSPGGMLWWLPQAGDVAMALRGGETGGPLTSYVLHGHGGKDGAVPDWLSDDKWGMSPPEGKALRVESRDKDLELDAPGDTAKVKLGAGGTPVARKGDDLSASGALAAWAQAVETALNLAGSAIPPGTTFADAAGLPGGLGAIHGGSSKVETE